MPNEPDPTPTPQPSASDRLRTNFQDHAPTTHPSLWDNLWTSNFLPWDKGTPNPALIDLLSNPTSANPTTTTSSSAPSLLPTPQLSVKESLLHQSIRRKRALVPGCGRGYDVLLLSAFGFDAYGVEGSRTAVEAAREGKKDLESGEGGMEEGQGGVYRTRDERVGRGEARFLFGDFFDAGWCQEILDVGAGEGFDLIYDYTFLCALPPALRPKWAQRMSQLLSPSGRLICLEFPTYKAPSLGGPPWAVRPAFYVAYLSRPGESIEYGEDAVLEGFDEERPERSRDGLVRMAHWQPERSHEIGQGTDWISVWKHQESQ